jgi:hypothetical protein
MPKNPFTGVTNEARQAGADKRAADLVPIRERTTRGRRNLATGHRRGARRAVDSDCGRRSLASHASATAAGAAASLDAVTAFAPCPLSAFPWAVPAPAGVSLRPRVPHGPRRHRVEAAERAV